MAARYGKAETIKMRPQPVHIGFVCLWQYCNRRRQRAVKEGFSFCGAKRCGHERPCLPHRARRRPKPHCACARQVQPMSFVDRLPGVAYVAAATDASGAAVALCGAWWLANVALLTLTGGRWYAHMVKVHALAQFALLLSDDWADLFIATDLAMYASLLAVSALPPSSTALSFTASHSKRALRQFAPVGLHHPLTPACLSAAVFCSCSAARPPARTPPILTHRRKKQKIETTSRHLHHHHHHHNNAAPATTTRSSRSAPTRCRSGRTTWAGWC